MSNKIEENNLSRAELGRYARHLSLPQFSIESQQKLKNARVLVVGAGGLGCPVLLYLAAAGVGHIGIVDGDKVDASNLQRQIIYGDADVGISKAQLAAQRVGALNPFVDVQLYEQFVNPECVEGIISGYDLVIDGTDNFAARFLLHDASFFHGLPYVYGSIFQFHGQVSLFVPGEGPCYRCLFSAPPPPGTVPSCSEAGVLGVVPAVVGSLQAAEAIKYITGIGRTLQGRLLRYDALNCSFKESLLPRDGACLLCGDSPSIINIRSASEDYMSLSCQVPGQLRPEEEITVAELRYKLESGDPSLTVIDIREPEEFLEGGIPGSRELPLSNPTVLIEAILAMEGEVVLVCRSGGRTSRVINMIRDDVARQENLCVRSLKGGITRYCSEI
ncbi:MAG: HesA/MoeB/ThiF family protein [bacterium]|nr:HesA/MoeB/ThiF family protein [bacterium]